MCEKMSAAVFELSYNCGLKVTKLASECRVQRTFSSYQLERNRSVNMGMRGNARARAHVYVCVVVVVVVLGVAVSRIAVISLGSINLTQK